MSDSVNTNELESYGVWVKKPPLGSDSAAENQGEPEEFNLDTELPDIDDSASQSLEKNLAKASGEEEEIDLSEFGFDDSDDNSSQADSPSSSGEEEEVDLSEFGFDDSTPDDSDSSDGPQGAMAESTEITETETAPLSEDGPLDIDLSFDDSMPTDTQKSAPSSSSFSGGGEEVDLSEFGFDDGPSESKASDDGTESVDLSEFGFDSATSEPAIPGTLATDEEEPKADSASDSGASSSSQEEEVDLSDFGFTDSNESDESEESSSADNDIDMKVEVDDDFDLPESDDSAEESDDKASPAKSQSSSDDGGFDIDSILNSVEDENGQTVSLGDVAGDSAQDGVESEKSIDSPETQEDTIVINDIPDTFDEETSSLFDDEPTAESDGAKKSVPEEAAAPAPAPATTALPNDVLSQLMTVITSLKDEVASLKNDFEELKKAPIRAAKEEDIGIGDDIPTETEEESSSSSGFFNDTDEDDTIALSMDELMHIENTAEFAEEEGVGDTPDSDTEEQIGEEPSADDTSFDEPTVSDSTEEENIPDTVADDEIPFPSSEEENIPSQEEVDDDDATLSLDELNNIQNTADFAEEEGVGDTPDSDTEENQIGEEPSVDDMAFDEPTVSDSTEEETISDTVADDEIQISSEEEDDDATLSLDELNNIQNTADFTEEEGVGDTPDSDTEDDQIGEEPVMREMPMEEPDTSEADNAEAEGDVQGESFDEPLIGEEELDFSNDNLVEPSLDDINMEEVQEEENSELPDEIEVPKVDDIFVESSSTDLMEEEQPEVAGEDFSEPEVAPEEIIEDSVEADDNLPEDIDVPAEEPSASDTVFEEPSVGDSVGEEEIVDEEPVTKSELNNLLAPNIEEEELTEGNLSYLESDEALKHMDEDEQKEESSIPEDLTKEIKAVLSYMDQLLENLPEEKIAEFAQSEQFETYKKLFTELGLD